MTLIELERLDEEFKEWKNIRTANDTRGQYRSQIDAVGREVEGALRALHGAWSTLPGDAEVGHVYRDALRLDQRIVWVRKAWQFFRDKFDQRDDEVLGPVLRAADEVVWSCFKPFFQGSGASLAPAPLPFVDTAYVPSAIRPDQGGHLERDSVGGDALLSQAFRTPPIPLLRLPPSVVTAPWTLTIIGHELGHLMQTHIEPDYQFFTTFRIWVDKAVDRAKGGEEDRAAWKRWSDEIFADWYLVLTMGQWSVAAIVPWELGIPTEMSRRRSYYPSASVRLHLLARMADHLGLPGGPALEKLHLPAPPVQDVDFAIADQVARAISTPLPRRQQRLDALLMFRIEDYGPNGAVDSWSAALRREKDLADEHDLRSARIVCASSLHALERIANDARIATEEDRGRSIEALREETIRRITACHEEGKRAAVAAAPRTVRTTLADVLMSANDDELFQ